MSSIYDWSLTAASNATADSLINWQEGQLPSTVNNSAREMMARMAELLKDVGLNITAGGTANALTITTNSPFTAYATGQIAVFKAASTNTGATTINANSIGAKSVRKDGDAALFGGELIANQYYGVIYSTALNGGSGGWLLINPTNPELFASKPGYIYGVTLANNGVDPTNDIDIAAGAAASDGSTPAIMTLASGLTKRLDAAWAVGTGNGGLDTGSIANTTYHVWLIQRSDTGVVDALFSASATSPTMPANYDRKRRIGSIMRVSGAIVPFIQTGDTFVRAVRIQDVSVTNPGTSAVTRTLSVPTGINVFPFGTVQIELTTSSAVTVSCLLTDLAQTDSDPGTVGGSVTLTTLSAGGSQRALSYFSTIKTNTSAQIRSRFNISGSATNFVLHTEGWVDTRGRT